MSSFYEFILQIYIITWSLWSFLVVGCAFWWVSVTGLIKPRCGREFWSGASSNTFMYLSGINSIKFWQVPHSFINSFIQQITGYIEDMKPDIMLGLGRERERWISISNDCSYDVFLEESEILKSFWGSMKHTKLQTLMTSSPASSKALWPFVSRICCFRLPNSGLLRGQGKGSHVCNWLT